ncbi:hypothetical protein ACFVU2_07045 [Leifsonia sp. NPDC058194]|uniref:hypothetical protein n=1 Tax=Leifsonia sp. NPDC058194 TaxID=3346374 RepID=UPI0036D863C3
MDENRPTEPLPPTPPAREPFYKRHGLAFAISTLVLGIVVLIGVVGVGTVVAVNVVTHSVSAFAHNPPRDGTAPGRQDGRPGQGGTGRNGGTAQRELVRGTLESESGSSWTVKTASGSTVTVKVTSSTAYGLPNQSASASDFATGDEVVVVGSDRTGDTITATRILKLTDFPRPPSTPGPTPGSGAP